MIERDPNENAETVLLRGEVKRLSHQLTEAHNALASQAFKTKNAMQELARLERNGIASELASQTRGAERALRTVVRDMQDALAATNKAQQAMRGFLNFQGLPPEPRSYVQRLMAWLEKRKSKARL